MECSNEKYCDIAKMVKKVAEDCNVPEKEVMEAVKKRFGDCRRKSRKMGMR